MLFCNALRTGSTGTIIIGAHSPLLMFSNTERQNTAKKHHWDNFVISYFIFLFYRHQIHRLLPTFIICSMWSMNSPWLYLINLHQDHLLSQAPPFSIRKVLLTPCMISRSIELLANTIVSTRILLWHSVNHFQCSTHRHFHGPAHGQVRRSIT